jgi:hypothetical protein
LGRVLNTIGARERDRFQVNELRARFYIYKDDEREMLGYPSLGQAAVEWIQDPQDRRVVQEDGEGHVLKEYSKDECRKAAQEFLRGGSDPSD